MTMANSMPVKFSCWCLLMCIVVCVFTIQAIPTNSSMDSLSNHEGLVLKIIHKDSIYSPGHTLADRINSALSLSRSRLHHLTLQANQTQRKAKAPIFSDEHAFMVEISIGTPPVRQLVSMDTGSILLWVQCDPCTNCPRTKNPLYDQKNSRTYSGSSCHEEYCKVAPSDGCYEFERCKFEVRYGNGSQSNGHVGFETLTFDTADGSKERLFSVLFGCATSSHSDNPSLNGVLGLGGRLPSLPFYTKGKFSYCIGNLSDPNFNLSRLSLGNEAHLDGPPVPLKIDGQGNYLVSLQGFKIGGTQLPINPKDYEFNVIIDSGSTFSFLRTDTYNAIKSEVQRIVKIVNPQLQEVKLMENPDSLCYNGLLGKDLDGFPSTSIWISTESKFDLTMEGVFWRVPGQNAFCLAIQPTTDGTYIIGTTTQQYHNIGFDLNSTKAFVTTKYCGALS